MPRFRDEWVIDRVLFDYLAGGSCACCGFSHMFLPNGTKDLIHAVSDLETDAAEQEIRALEHHPWPKELRDQIWADRVRFRQKAKMNMKDYQAFWKTHGDAFGTWLGGQPNLNRLFQMPRSEVMTVIRSSQYNIHSAYAVVLCTVMEQIACFAHTEYPLDGRGSVELDFEQHLQYDKRGGFVLKLQSAQVSGTEVDDNILTIWLKRMRSLGGPKLLDRGPSSSGSTATGRLLSDDDDDDDDDQGEGEDADGSQPEKSPTPSFQSDRRMVRLVIARYWADLLMNKYLQALNEPAEESGQKL